MTNTPPLTAEEICDVVERWIEDRLGVAIQDEGGDVRSAFRAELAELLRLKAAPVSHVLVDALRAIANALKEPDGGDYWQAREFLDRYDVFHSDLSGTRVLNQVALTALNEAEKEVRL